jgi:membrane protein YqaA with SNARE-associated domain
MAKLVIYAGIAIGGIVGAYLPVAVLHVSAFGAVSLIGSLLGSIVGLCLGYRLNQWIDE